MLFNCPQCGQTLKAADNAAGKKCKCTQCQQLVVIPGAIKPPTTPQPSPQSKAVTPGRPASVASELDDMIVRQQEQYFEQAAQRHQHRERAQRQAAAHAHARKHYAKSSSSSSASPLRSVITTVVVVSGLLLALCCGIGSYTAFLRTTQLSVGGFSITARGHGEKRTHNEGIAQGESVLNRLTGSEYLLFVMNIPNGDPNSFSENLSARLGGRSSSQHPVQRGNLSGTHYSNVSVDTMMSSNDVRGEVEVFVQGNRFVMAAYLSGSAKYEAGVNRRRSSFETQEEFFDNPEGFFASLQPQTP